MTEEKSLVISETLESAREYNLSFLEGVKNCINDLDGGRIEEALKTIPLITDGLLWLIKAIYLTASIQKYTINLEDLNNVFMEVNDALGNRDFTLLADILRYEIMTRLEEWNMRNFGDNSIQVS